MFMAMLDEKDLYIIEMPSIYKKCLGGMMQHQGVHCIYKSFVFAYFAFLHIERKFGKNKAKQQ